MITEDNCCSIVPYFQVEEGKMDEFKRICDRFMERTSQEPQCLYYGFSFNGNIAHCREGYENAQGVIAHLENVDDLLTEALAISDIIRLEIHGNQAQINQLKKPLAQIDVEYFVLEYGFRR